MTYHGCVAETERLLHNADDFLRQFEGEPDIVRLVLGASYVRVAGFIENAHLCLLTEYANRTSQPNVANLVHALLKKGTNYNAQRCIDLWSSFSKEYGKRLKEHREMAPEGRWQSALGGVYGVRLSQAHGGSQLRSIGDLLVFFKDVQGYFKYVKDEFLA